MQANQPADSDSPLRPVGFAIAAATATAHLALAVVSLRRSCLRYGDLLHGLCLHAGLVGFLQAGLVILLHALLYSNSRTHDQPLWRIFCKIYLFCRIFLPGLFLYLTAAITVCFRSIRYPPRRCGQSCTRLGYLTAHCLPWAACSAGLLPVLMMHKEGTEVALRNQGHCLLIERWAWLGPLLVLMGAPLLADLMLTCLLCAYKPYRSSQDSPNGEGSSVDSGDPANVPEFDYDDEGGGDTDERHRRLRGNQPKELNASSRGNGYGRGSTAVLNEAGSAPTTTMTTNIADRGGGRYYTESRLLRGSPMRLARSLLLTMSLLQACTQLPHCITAVLQTILRNLQSRQLIQQPALDALYWIHLTYFPIAGVILTAFILQLHRAFRSTEGEIERDLQGLCPNRGGSVREVLQTTSMLTSL